MRIACQEGLLPGRRFDEKWRYSKKIGLEAIEINGEFEDLYDRRAEISHLAAGSSVKPSTICGSAQGCLLASGGEDRTAAVEDVRKLLGIAAEIRASGLVFAPLTGMVMGQSRSPRIPDLYPLYSRNELEKNLLVELLRDIAQFAESVDASLFLEPVNRFQTLWPTTVAEVVEICRLVGSPKVKVAIDLFHMNIEEENPVQSIRSAGDYVGHVHICDSNRRLPNKGHIDFGAVVGALKEINYDGYLALECQMFDESAEEELPVCLEFVRNLL